MVIPCGAAWRSTITADAIFDSFSSLFSQCWTLRVDVFIIIIIWRERDASLFHSMKHCARLWSLIRQQRYSCEACTIVMDMPCFNFLIAKFSSAAAFTFPLHKMEIDWVNFLPKCKWDVYTAWRSQRYRHGACGQMKKLENWLTAQTNDSHTFCMEEKAAA